MQIKGNNRLAFLYCISYIKYYCFFISKIFFDEEYQNIEKNEIFSFLDNNSNFRKMIKIYILKVLNLIIIKDYNEFKNVIEEEDIFFNDFDFTEKNPCPFNNLFINNESFAYYKNLKNIYMLCNYNKYKSNKEIIEVIGNDDNLMNFYDLIINEEISNLINNFRPDAYNILSHFVLDILNKLKVSRITKEIFSLFYKIELFKEKILPSIKNISLSHYEILLYSHKFAVISSMSKHESIYSKIISKNFLQNISDLYIPGGEPNDSLKIKSAEEIQKYLNSGASDGVYMCECNFWYVVDRCTRPMETNTGRNCGKVIGGINHVLIGRTGHVRIIRDN